MQQLFNYAEVDELCATTALNAFSRQFWYLTGEFIHLCLFSNKLTATHNEEMATKSLIFNVSLRNFEKLEKPVFPEKPKSFKEV